MVNWALVFCGLVTFGDWCSFSQLEVLHFKGWSEMDPIYVGDGFIYALSIAMFFLICALLFLCSLP